MISWKDSFEKINNELDLARKKKDALEVLSSDGRISQLTYDSLNDALTVEIDQIENRRKELAEKMTSKLNELARQVNALETFLANVEMSYAAGEITEELHGQEVSALSLGLEATKNELNFIKDAITQLVPEETEPEPAPAVETAEAEASMPAEAVIEPTPEEPTTAPIETQVETPSVTDETNIDQSAEVIAETPETPEMPEVPTETPAEELADEIAGETIEENIPEEAALETPTEEVVSEEEVLPEALTEEAVSEEQVLPEISTEESIPEEAALEIPTEEVVSEEEVLSEISTEETAEEILPEEQVISEASTEEDQPFRDENLED